MTVKDLIAELKMMPQDIEVKFSYPSRDYWHSVLAGNIQNVEEGAVTYSEYHRTDEVIDQDDEENVRRSEHAAKRVVLLT